MSNNKDVEIRVFASPKARSLDFQDESRVAELIRNRVLPQAKADYYRVDVKIRRKKDQTPQYLVAYMLRKDIYLAEVVKVNVDANFQEKGITFSYDNSKDKEEDEGEGEHDLGEEEYAFDFVFATPVPEIPSAQNAVEWLYEQATKAGFRAKRLLGAEATVANYKKFLTSRLKGFVNIGHGNASSIILDDGPLPASWFQKLANQSLKPAVIYFNSCQVHNDPLKSAVMHGGARTFIGGIVNLLIGPSEEVCNCFWGKVIISTARMDNALHQCEKKKYPEIGAHGITGDTGPFPLVTNEDIFTLKENNFVLWRGAPSDPPPQLIIGKLQPGAPVTLVDEQRFDLKQSDDFPDHDIWIIPAAECNLTEGQVYHYWFEVKDTHPKRSGERVRVTDPMAFTVDWRLRGPRPEGSDYSDDDQYPAAVVKFSQNRLIPCDAGGETGELQDEPSLNTLPPNNRLVIYEIPTAWTRGEHERGVGTFRDVTALIDPNEGGANFSDLAVTQAGRSYLTELGVNAIELLPPADSFYVRDWGYGTTNFCAPDFELGFPDDYSHPAPNRDLRGLVAACHTHGLRFFVDVVPAFARTNAYLAAATDDFFILNPASDPSDPDAHNSRGGLRNGFGSTLFRYETFKQGYDPVTGESMSLSPSRQLMKVSLLRWMNDFHIDGIRMDTVENVFSWNFIGEYKDLARKTWRDRYASQGTKNDADARFLVVGEELEEPLELLRQQRLDGLWHESFKRYIRAALVGESAAYENFEWTVRKAIDCRNCGYSDGAQAIIYLGSHDVEGFRNERLYDYFQNNGVLDSEKRIKLAFACLLTAVGVPQILAGDEFADKHDLFDKNGNVSQGGGKQVDPVNYSRLDDDWRSWIKDYVARLIKFRTTSKALAVNDTDFIHVDFHGKRVLAWRRGRPDVDDIVVVVANFSDFCTDDPHNPRSEYRVNNWPAPPPGKRWREITQDRDVPPEWAGREPIYPWEAKVYTLV